MRAELVPIDGGPPIPITKDITVVGRREFCDVQLDDPSLSKRHCVLIKTDGLLMVRDLASTNGTRVKGQLIRWAALLPNDRIAFGKVKFRVFLGPAEPARSPEFESTQYQAGPSQPDDSLLPLHVPPKSRSLVDDGPEIDLDDSRWFNPVEPGAPIEKFFDLD